MLKRFILLLIGIMFLVGCGSGTDNSLEPQNSKVKALAETFDDIGLEQLNPNYAIETSPTAGRC